MHSTLQFFITNTHETKMFLLCCFFKAPIVTNGSIKLKGLLYLRAVMNSKPILLIVPITKLFCY